MIAKLKIWKRGKNSKVTKPATENPSVIDIDTPGPAVEAHIDTAGGSEVSETFKEHYPLLLPFSYAAIVEDEKNEVKYSLLEPTLTELDKQLLAEIKNILWDELSVNTKDFKYGEEADEFLKFKILDTAIKYRINVDANTLGKYQYYIAQRFLRVWKDRWHNAG